MASTKKQQLDELVQAAIGLYRAGQLDEAIGHLVVRTNDFPKAPRLWGYLGFLYGEAENHTKAKHAFLIATRLSPHSEQASLGLFHALWHQGKINAAFDEMRRFVKSNDSPRYRRLIQDMLAETPENPAKRREPLAAA